jgi:hypothetical protein
VVAYQRGVTWGGFLLVLGTIALLSIVRLPFPDEKNLGFFLWYWLGWASLGAFSGMTVVVARATRDLRALWHVAVAVLTIICLSLLLGDQDFFRNGPANLLCSLGVVALLWKCMVVNRQLPAGVRGFARPITTVTALAVVLRLAAPPHFFLPILYGPEAALARSRTEIGAERVSHLLLIFAQPAGPQTPIAPTPPLVASRPNKGLPPVDA